jgi:phytoene dehydrogenase-like protein
VSQRDAGPRSLVEPSRTTPVYGEFDVVVVRGGPAGLMAASAAARSGRSTILLEWYGYLGGAGTAGGLSTFCGLHATVHGEHQRVIHGLADETGVLARDLRQREARIGVTALCPGTIATNLFHGSRNRPEYLRNEEEPAGAQEGRELRERMHAVLAEGMSPADVADKLMRAIRSNSLYLLTDHECDERVIDRHRAILAGAAGPALAEGTAR